MYQSFLILKIIRSRGDRKRGLLSTTIFIGHLRYIKWWMANSRAG